MKVFAKRLKYERDLKKFSQAEMAEKLNIPRSTYAHYEEEGKSGRNPTLEILVEIAKILEVSIDYLLGVKEIDE